ncbi:MAG: lipoate--protein ligase family protein [Thermoplasmata archaeon]|nr:lipoate--protein ligase family protein [Thermoplasmata archaeon]
MALDETFLDLASSGGDYPAILHFYRKRPSISLGYFQSAEEEVDLEVCDRDGVGIFRRTSGGGAIFEDENQLIYGLVLPDPGIYGVPNATIDSFGFINRALILTLADFGLSAEFVPVNDVLVHGKKISGCAQTRRKGALLQHGTLILDHDPSVMFRYLKVDPGKLKAKGLTDAEERVTSLKRELGKTPDPYMVKEGLDKGFSRMLGIEFSPSELTGEERERAKKLCEERYSRNEWNFMR